jgi:predicted RND superfamily exporter protein
MDTTNAGRLSRFFTTLIAWRWWVVALYAALLAPSAYYATKVGQDNSIDRLIVASDPDYIGTRAFEQVFGGGEYALLLIETPDPLAPDVVRKLDAVERAVQELPRLTTNSLVSVYRRARAGFEPTPEGIAAFRQFATGTDQFRRQGLIGDRYLALALVFDVHDSADRLALLRQVEQAIRNVEAELGPITGLHRLGQPYVNVYLDETQRSAPFYFVIFAGFVIVLTMTLYRSLRTLAAFLIALGVCLAVSVGFIGVMGGMFTIVSPMVPMTILVTATATLVYIQSRFVDRPPNRSFDEHLVFALDNKFVACTASIFATAAGFGALAISDIRPIREMGIWVAVGLTLTWIIVFTLFPVLQKILRTPTQQEVRPASIGFEPLARWLPGFTYRWRWPLVGTSLALSFAGAIALFGFPGLLAPMPLLTDPVEYMNHQAPLYRDIKRLGPITPGLSVTHVWLKGSLGSVAEPGVLTGLHAFQQGLEADPDVGAAVGLTSILRIIRYLSGAGDTWPQDDAAVEQIGAELEGLLPQEPMLQRFVQPHELAQTQVTVISHVVDDPGFQRLNASVRRIWANAVAQHPALQEFTLETVGLAPLNAKMAQNLVPTLVESFALTVAIIFCAFVVVFRSGTARLMAIIPSLFAILVMFLIMRMTGMMLNIATILIASTVLGTSENDQIHFFYHFLEGRQDGTVEHALRHTLLVAGRAIVFATMINAGGFLAFTLGELPPMTQFGFLAALAFVLSMLADFTALPAALWILFRERPDAMAANAVPVAAAPSAKATAAPRPLDRSATDQRRRAGY